MRRDARLALRLVLNQHIRPRPAATQTTAAPRLRRLGLRLGPRGQVEGQSFADGPPTCLSTSRCGFASMYIKLFDLSQSMP